MFATSPSTLLHVWEAHQQAHPVQRALQLLGAASPGADAQRWAASPVGVRDGALLRLHEHLFGGCLRTVAHCPQCGERLETEFDVDAVGAPVAPEPAVGPVLTWSAGGYDVDFRLPCSDDLLQVLASSGDAESAAHGLLRRCIRSARHEGLDLDPVALPQDVQSGLEAEMARIDPQADIHAELRCPGCGAGWQARFDVVSYLWGELDDWALRTLGDVHLLARAYGWSEDAILALTPARRQFYVDMVNA